MANKKQAEQPQMQVEWKDVPNHDGYMVNSLGEVWSKNRTVEKNLKGKRYVVTLKGKKLKAWESNAYLYCSLGCGTKCGVHRIVCMAFHGVPRNKNLEAAHLDGNAHNNTPENLAWATRLENEQMKIQHGTLSKGKAHFGKPWHKKRGPKPSVHPDAQKIIEMRENGAKWDEIAKVFGMSRSGVYGIAKFRSGGALCR